MKHILGLVFFTVFCTTLFAQPKLEVFPLQDVRLLPGLFSDAEKTDMNYMMQMDADRLLAPYLREAGLKPKAESYTNWENSGLDGHIGGHYLSALAMMYASTGDKKVIERLNYMLAELKRCQDKNGDGYVGGVPGSRELWSGVFKGDFTSYKKKWVPLYNIHKTFAGIRDAYLYTGNKTAKSMLLSFAGWFVKLSRSLSPQKMQEMLDAEHGGVNEVLADVYAITGDKKYLSASYNFAHEAVLKPLERREDRLNNLHANTQIPKVIGFERIGSLNKDAQYTAAARFFWETVVKNRTVAIGGNSVREHFNPAGNFSSMMNSEEGPETCNTYNMLKLTRMLYLDKPSADFIDYYERALYNHILSTQDPVKGGFVYFTPMRAGHYRVYSQPQTSMWCCVGSGMENHAKYGELIYANDAGNIYVNLFIPSTISWREKGLKLIQRTRFPDSETTIITVDSVKNNVFGIQLRYPGWVKPGAMSIQINGKKTSLNKASDGFVKLIRRWKKGDEITVHLPMHTTTEQLPDGSNYEAVLHGPIVLAAAIDTLNMQGLRADDSRMGHVAKGPMYPAQQMPVFVGSNKQDVAQIRAVAGRPLRYTAASLIYPAKFRSLQLVPFYTIHNARYIVYWRKETPESLAAMRKKQAEEDAEAAKLAALTLDVVSAGEQQPESDHFMESENSGTGVSNDRHWRDARGWFSYVFSDKNRQAGLLRITYFGKDKDRKFNILVNGKTIAPVQLDGSGGDGFFTADYSIPQEIVSSSAGKLKVRFEAVERSVAGGIYEVRLLKKQ